MECGVAIGRNWEGEPKGLSLPFGGGDSGGDPYGGQYRVKNIKNKCKKISV